MPCRSRYGASCWAAYPLGNSRGAAAFHESSILCHPCRGFADIRDSPHRCHGGLRCDVPPGLPATRITARYFGVAQFEKRRGLSVPCFSGRRGPYKTIRISCSCRGTTLPCPAGAAQLVVFNAPESLPVEEAALTASYPDDILNVNETGLPGL
jgi:hypothetical protein